jgi:hypothetical protein
MKNTYSLLIFFISISFSNAQNWQQFGTGLLGGTSFMVDNIQNRLCIIGKFIDQNNDTAISPAFWNGANWSSIGSFDFSNTGGPPYKMLMYDSTLYLGGGFEKAYGAPGNYILKLNNSNNWDTLDFSPNSGVHSIYEYQTRLYIGGTFKIFGPLWSNGIIIHNPPFWSTIPPFTHLPWIESMIEYDNKLIIGGLFSSDLTLDYKGNIVLYDGINILPMADGLDLTDPYSLIIDLEVYNNKLFAAGNIHASNVSNSLNIVCWDGQSWSGVGGGVNNDIYDLQVYNGELYAAGTFTMAGNIPADHIAKWDGFKWCSLGSNFNGFITDMCVFNNELLVTGSFTQIDGQPINHIAKWIGGNYTDSCQVVGIEDFSIDKQVSIFPSPTNDFIKIKSEKYKLEVATISDLSGKIIFTKKISGTNETLDVSFLSSGLYFLYLQTSKGGCTKKFVKE